MNIKIGDYKYSTLNQKKFSYISKDFNPIHFDKLEARKLLFGKEIVHGINILLTGLNFLYRKKDIRRALRIECNFFEPLFLEQKVDFFLSFKSKNRIEISVKHKKNILCKFIIYFNSNYKAVSENSNQSIFVKKIERVKIKKLYDNNCLIHKKNRNFKVNSKNFNFGFNFPNLKSKFNLAEIKEILCLSYFVGMICPGKNSLISKIEINFQPNFDSKKNNHKYLNFRLMRFLKAFNQLNLNFNGKINGNILAYKYTSPNKYNFKDLKKFSSIKLTDTLKKKKSLVLGGSRGLGEITSKFLILQKCMTYVSYNVGIKDIEKIKKQIDQKYSPFLKFLKLDIFDKKIEKIIDKYKNIDYLFYFASPKILGTSNGKFSKSMFKEYIKFYLHSFKKICAILNKTSKKNIKVFYPSTIFISNKNQNFQEYVLAKRLAENELTKFQKKLKKIKIIIYRLPEMNTEQNSKIIGKNDINNFDILIPLIKKFIIK